MARSRIAVRKHRPDYMIVLIVGVLLLISLIVIYSIGPALQGRTGISSGKQLLAIGVSIAAFATTAVVPLQAWQKLQGWIMGVAITASALVYLLPGEVFNPDIKGAKRWLVFGPLSFQPSELVKFALVLYLASFFAKKIKQDTVSDASESVVPVAIILSVLGGIIVLLQRDLGTMLVIAAIALCMLYIAGGRLRHIWLMAGTMLLSGVLAVLIAPHRVARFLTFLDPSADITGAGHHINQALIGIGSGGLFGLGLGKSVQAYGYLPEAANDSIFAIFAEKFGFIGVMVLLIALGLLLSRVMRVVAHAPNSYTRLIAAGVFAWLFAHMVINIGAMLGLLPLTGITLPFLSYGGSSLLFIMTSLGLLFNISRYISFQSIRENRGEEGAHAHTRHRRRVRRSRRPA